MTKRVPNQVVRVHRLAIALFCFAMLTGCGNAKQMEQQTSSAAGGDVSDSIARVRQDSINQSQPGYIVDSLLPVEEEIRRFRAGISASTVTDLQHASPSLDSLVARFARAVELRDTADLLRMDLSAREFIDLYYPESPHTHPPYRQSPGYLWGWLDLSGSKGLTRLLQRRGGTALEISGVTCNPEKEVQGRNILWKECELLVRDTEGIERRERLFGSIIERDGRFKFLNFANNY